VSRRYAPRSARSRRRAILRNQIADLIIHESLNTTEVRAKALKSEVERLISRTKSADLAVRRRVLSFLPKDPAVEKLFDQIIPQFRDRTGGFVRIVKLSPRRGDRAPMARVEFVEKIRRKDKEEAVKKGSGKKAKAARKLDKKRGVAGKKKEEKKESRRGGGLKGKRVRSASVSKSA
jgi:large subunit ribosomal protein L17